MKPSPGFPVTPAQASILLSERRQPGTARFVEALAYRLVGTVKPEVMASALKSLIARHDVTRSSFHIDDGRGRHVPAPDRELKFEATQVAPELLELTVSKFLASPMNPETGDVFRGLLLSSSPEEHVLVVASHHLVADDGTFDLMTRELAVLYRAASEGKDLTLPPAEQLGAYLSASAPERVDSSLKYWRGRLDGAPTLSTVPVDRSRPREPDASGGQVVVKLGGALRRLTRALRSTPASALLAAVHALIYRHTEQRDIVVGLPRSTRRTPRTDEIAGCFVDLMPIRQVLSGSQSFSDLVGNVAEEISTGLAHGGVSFAQLARDLGDRAHSGRPLCQVVATVNERPAELDLPGVRAERLYPHNGTSKYDLFIQAVPQGSGHIALLEYSSALFDRSTVERLAERLVCLLDCAADDPEVALQDLELLPPHEFDLVTELWPSGPVVPHTDRPVHQFFETQVSITPDAPAVKWKDTQLSYKQLDDESERLAEVLRDQGVAGGVVGIMLDRSFDMVTAVLAVLKAGAAYLPLDRSYPVDRLNFMLRDSQVRFLLAAEGTPVAAPVTLLSPRAARRVAPDTAAPSTEAPGHRNQLAYIIYTSGSTGLPKGIGMPHRALRNLIRWQLDQSPYGSGTTLQYSALGFDVSFQEMFSTWAAGGTLVLIEEKERVDPAQLLQAIVSNNVDRIFLPYAGLQHLATYCVAVERYPSALREVITAGEQLIVTDSIRTLFQHCPFAILVNQYGPSETHVVTALAMTGDPSDWPNSPSIGRPIDNVQVHLVDTQLHPVPLGAVGELLIGGAAVATGYIGSAQSAGGFVEHPWSPVPSIGYRTGDLGRFRTDGNIEFLGRRDGQVKVRGHRIELGEIEHLLTSVVGVTEAVVVVRQTATAEAQLVAYVQAQADRVQPTVLREELERKLPRYMVPGTFTVLDTFPRTPSGKIDRRALSARTPEAPVAAGQHRQPRDRLEIELCGLWSSVLNVPDVGVDDDFFDLGGSSFSGVQLVALIRTEMGHAIELPILYRASTVGRLAEFLRGTRERPRTTSLVKLRDGHDARPPLFCFHALPGSVVRFGVFKRLLRRGRAIYGLQARGLDPRLTPHVDVVEMARDYVSEIRDAYPLGPYALFGFSLGGVIAFEAARQLRQAGADVELLALGDTDSSWDFESTRGDVLEHLVTKALRLDLDLAELATMDPSARVKRILESGVKSGALTRDFGLPRLRRMLEMYETNATAVANYEVLPYPGDVLLIRAKAAPPPAEADLGWGRFTSSVAVEWVSSDHFHMLEPENAVVVAEILDTHLDHAESQR